MKDLKFEKFIPPSKPRKPVLCVCLYEKEFAEHREEYIEQTLHTKRLAALESLRGVVAEAVSSREKPTGFFDESKAWINIRNALGAV